MSFTPKTLIRRKSDPIAPDQELLFRAMDMGYEGAAIVTIRPATKEDVEAYRDALVGEFRHLLEGDAA
jgi:hypothetical protein